MLDRGECFTFDERRDGEALITGGRQGKTALAAVRTIDGSWPEFHADVQWENMVLAAVKAALDFTGTITSLISCKCFVSSNKQAVYPMEPSLGRASGFSVSRVDPAAYHGNARRIRSVLDGMIRESSPISTELFDAIVLGTSTDDSYLRLWYLRLWQALVDAGDYLGHPQLENRTQVIAGKSSPKDLTVYRNDVAHWHTGKIDHSRLKTLQLTALELLRRKHAS